MGLLLRPDAYYARTPGGAHVLTPDGECGFTGRTVYELIDRLAPLLDGSRSLDDLTAGLSAERQEMVRSLITALADHSIVGEAGPGSGPGAALARYQETVTVVTGTGRLSEAVVAAAVRSGLRNVHAVAGLGSALPDGTGLVLHAADVPVPEQARRLGRLCGAAGVAFAQAAVAGDRAWFTAPADGGGGAGWASGARRLAALRPGATDSPAALGGLEARVVASQFVQAAIGPGGSGITSVSLTDLSSQAHALVPHPFELPAPGGEADLAARVAVLRNGARFDDERFSRHAFRCADDHVGVFTPPGERDFSQIPLHVCEARVSDPAGLLGAGSVPRVTGAALDFATARYRAALAAFATYGSLMVDPRRVRTGTAAGQPAGPCSDPDQALAALRAGGLAGFVAGYGLADGATALVDVARVFPALRTPAVPYVAPAGTAAGYDWDEAVVAGLLSQCLRITADEAAAAAAPFPRLDLPGAVLGERGDRYRALLEGLPEPVTVYDITGPLGVPAVVCYLGTVPVSSASGLSAADAVTDALQRLVLWQQSREAGQPGYAPPPVRGLPARLRGHITVALRGGRGGDAGAGAGEDAGAAVGALAGALLARGHRAVAVPLDHDPGVSALMPYIVRVVIAGE